MATTQLMFHADQELPVITFDWSAAGENFATGWTFEVRLARSTAKATTLLLKTTGITSTATTVSVAFTSTDFVGLENSVNGTDYVLHLYARRVSDGKDLVFSPGAPTPLKLFTAPGTSAVSPSSYPITVTAASVTFNPTGTIASTDVQAAIAEVATDYAAADAAEVTARNAAIAAATPAASTTVSGIVELATNAEALARTDTVRAVTPANLSQFTTVTRYNLQRALPTAALAQSIPRWAVNVTSSSVLSSGRQNFYRIWLPAGTISSISFVSGTTGATTPTNQWFSIYDSNRNKLAVTVDDTTTAWAASTVKTLSITGGYAAAEGEYYIGIMFAGTTPPQLATSTGSNPVNTLAPILAGFDATNTGLTTPVTAPSVAATLTASAALAYCYVS